MSTITKYVTKQKDNRFNMLEISNLLFSWFIIFLNIENNYKMSSTNTQQYFICPITLKIFNDPVIAQDGITYEREAIIQWINQHGTSPLTKIPIYIQQLTSNNTIKDAIKTLKQQNTHNGQVNLDC